MKRWIPAFLALSGCMLGPDYHRPALCTPSEYEEAPVEREEINLTSWWEQFHDPVLDSLISQALTCNLDYRIALHRIEEFRELYHIERSSLYPQIQANMVALRERFSQNVTAEPDTSNLSPAQFFPSVSGPAVQSFFQLGFDAIWELDLFGKNRRKSEAGFADFQASQEEALFIQVTLLSDVARTYIDSRSLHERIVAKQEQIQKQEELLDLAETRYCAGLTSYLDVTQAKRNLVTEKATLPPLEEEYKVALHALALLLGSPPENFELAKGELPLAEGKIPPGIPSDLLNRRPDIRRAEQLLHAATARIGVAKADLFPSFSLTSSLGVQANQLSKLLTWPSRYWTVGPSAIWNLFTGGKLVSQVRVENERTKQALLTYEKTLLEALKEVEDRLVGYYKEEERLFQLKERVETLALVRTLTADQFCAGLISFDDVLTAERNYFLSKQEAIQSEGVLMIQLVGLYKALGGGWSCSELP